MIDIENDNEWGYRNEKDIKARELENSKQLDVHTWSEHPEVNNFVNAIYEKHFVGRKKNIRKKHLKVILLDLYVTWTEDPTRKITVYRSPSNYKAGTRYNELNISRTTIPVVDVLIGAKLVEQAKGFYYRKDKRGKLSRIWPTEALIAIFKNVRFTPFDISSQKDRLTVILRDKDPDEKNQRDVEYHPTEETAHMSDVLTQYNDLLASTYIDIPILDEVGINIEKNGKPSKLIVSQRDKFVRRVFNRGSFEFGGRFNGGWWQRCPKEWRSKLFINDRSTNEIDFSGLHIVMLYAVEGIDYWEVDGTDPYGIATPDFLKDQAQTRAIAKKLMLMLLNAKDDNTAYKAFRKKSPYGSAEKSFKNHQLIKIHDLLSKKHPHIAKYFGADAGIRLMNKDSQITEDIISRFLEKSVPVLSIHDSYIIQVGYEEELIEAMHTAFEKVMGIPLGGRGAKALKEQDARVEDLEAALNTWMPYERVEWQKKDEKAYIERCHPKRTERYLGNWKLFQEWLKKKQP